MEKTAFEINDFIDFNYRDIAFDITKVDKETLRKKLEDDYVSHLWELDNANYILIENCDLQGFESLDDLFFFDRDYEVYKLCELMLVNGKICYKVIDVNKRVNESAGY